MRDWLNSNCQDWYDSKHEYSSLIEKKYPLPTNRRKFIETEVADKIPSIGYAYLVRIAESDLVKTIFTTNFDDLLNEAFYQFSSERALVCAHDSDVSNLSITASRSKIIKLHGDYLFDDIRNIRPETTDLGVNMKGKLTEFLKEYGLILTGYSGSDKSITSILEELTKGEPYLQNGLFWCFREEDEINDETLEILRKDKSFYVIVPGFDELMADIYEILDTKSTPFSSKLASDRASNIIESYLKSNSLKTTTSSVIKKHLELLESDKNTSLMSDIMMDLNAERIASSGLSDKNMLVYLEIEKSLRDRNPEAALERLGKELSSTKSKRFKEILLHRRFVCSTRLNKINEARQAINEMLSLEPVNYYVALSQCSLLDDRDQRIRFLQDLKEKHPYSYEILNQYAEEVMEALDKNNPIAKSLKREDAFDAYKRSVEVEPSLSNPAWGQLFYYTSKGGDTPRTRKEAEEIVDTHLTRDAYCAETTSLLYRYCKKFKTVEYKSKPLFEYLNAAYTHHFPRDYANHMRTMVNSCIEFDGHRYLRPVLEEARNNEDLNDDPHFARIMMEVYFDVFRDLNGAIEYGRSYLKSHKNKSVEVSLLNILLAAEDVVGAREIHASLKGAIEISEYLSIEATILEHEGRYQDAIDALESIPDKREFEETYTNRLSYIELSMGLPARALKRCKAFLNSRSFSMSFEAEIINYEYAKLLDKRKIDQKRINTLLSTTDSESVKGVCLSLLGEESKALEIFRHESTKRFKNIFEYLRWPAIGNLKKELLKIRIDLEKAKRSLDSLPKV